MAKQMKALEKENARLKKLVADLSLDRDTDTSRKYAEPQQLGWTQSFLGGWSKTNLPAQYGVRGIPSIFLIDPEGKIAAKGHRGERIMQAAHERLGERQVSWSQ